MAAVSVEEALQILGTCAEGLTEAEAASRKPKQLRMRRISLWPYYLRENFANALALLLWAAALLAAFLHWLDPTQGMDRLALAVVAIVAVNGTFGLLQEFHVERTLEALRRLLPATQTVLRNGDPRQVAVDAIVPGDVLVLEEGDVVPADARVLQVRGLTVNMAPLTGESEPRILTDSPQTVTQALDASNIAFAGCTVLAGSGHAVVFRVGEATELGRIGTLVATVHEQPGPLVQQLNQFSRRIALVALALGLLTLIAATFLGRSLFASALFSIGIFVALVPEGLPPTVTMALALIGRDLARRNALVKYLAGIETLGSVTYICTDKTGTLTLNRMQVRLVTDDTQVVPFPPPRSPLQDLLWRAVAIANEAEREEGKHAFLGDPTEVALLEAAEAYLGGLPEVRRVRELPFTAERRRMSVAVKEAEGLRVYMKGAPEAVIPLCAGSANDEERLWSDGDRKQVAERAGQLAERGLCVLAVAYRPQATLSASDEELERDLRFLGLVGLLDPPRPGVKEAIEQCLAAGVRICVLTGDHPATAVAVAREIGLADAAVLPADTFFALPEPERLSLFQERRNVVLARFSPEAKWDVVRFLIDAGEIVAVTGDGVNDAPALKQAHIGVAMGRTGTAAAREAADLILLDDRFETIVVGIAEGRRVFANVRKFLTYVLTSNVAELAPYLAYILLQVPLPLTIMQILAIDLGTDLLPAMALGVEPGRAELMRRPPRPPTEPLFDRFTFLRAFTFLGLLEAATGLGAYALYLWYSGWSPAAGESWVATFYRSATTACLAAIVWTQVFNVFACRSSDRPAWRLPLLSNRSLLVAVAVEIGLLVLLVYASPLHAVFETAALPAEFFFLGIVGGVALLLADGIRARFWPHPE